MFGIDPAQIDLVAFGRAEIDNAVGISLSSVLQITPFGIIELEDVGACAARQRVKSQSAGENIVARIAGEDVGILAADDILDLDQRIARRILACGEVDDESACEGRVVNCVGTGAADDNVVTVTAYEKVIAIAPGKHIVTSAAPKRVIAIATEEDVVTGTTIEVVIASASFQRVIALVVRTASQPVIAVATEEMIIAGTTVQRVVAAATPERIVVVAAAQEIIAITTKQMIGARAAIQPIRA